jgi:uncharacterized phiE125 gp8 family phage protein
MFRNHDISDGGRAILITPPALDDPAVSLADAKVALGITDDSQDAIVAAAINAAADVLDPAAGGWLGRALRPQIWQLQLRSFGEHRAQWRRHSPHAIVLPYPPLLSVDSVQYLDVNGANQTLASGTDFRILGIGQPFGKAWIAPLYAGSWPVCRIDDASVRVEFTCGYDDSDESDMQMPRSLTNAIILGARALMSISTKDMTLFEDNVVGIGYRRYQNSPAVADIVNKAVQGLLTNLATL